MAKDRVNLLTIADGYGDTIAVPASWYPDYLKWPELIQLMTHNVALTNCSRYGAGNEYITNCLQENIKHQDCVLIQWAQPNRLDLVLDHRDTFWTDTIAADLVYNNNKVNVGSDQFWLSSASTTAPVREYHEKFISIRQHQLRSQLYIDYATLLLKQHDIEFKFMLTEDSEYLAHIDPTNWIWHGPWHGMRNFKKHSKYSELDFGLNQPIPLIFFEFIKLFIMPQVNLPWRNNTQIAAVENMLYRKYNQALENRPK